MGSNPAARIYYIPGSPNKLADRREFFATARISRQAPSGPTNDVNRPQWSRRLASYKRESPEHGFRSQNFADGDASYLNITETKVVG